MLLNLELRLLNRMLKNYKDDASHHQPKIADKEIRSKVVAVATTESNNLKPGSTYLGRILLIKSLSGPSIQMTCDGRRLSIDSDGAGQVSFIAPTKQGQASWQATIEAKISGRDTAFHINVPYRVVRQ